MVEVVAHLACSFEMPVEGGGRLVGGGGRFPGGGGRFPGG